MKRRIMIRRRTVGAFFCLGPWALSCAVFTPSVSRADDQDVIDYRQHIMKTLGEQAMAIDQIVKQKAPPDHLATHVEILAITASTAKKAFEPQVQGGQAQAAVWTNWAEFAQRMDELAANTNELLKATKVGGVTATSLKLASTLTCKGCHDTFVEKASPTASPAAGQDAVEYREHMMKTLNEQSGALGQILSSAIADDNAVAHLEVIALAASITEKSFEPKVPGGQSKPEVWSNWADFSKRMHEFASKTAAVAKLANEKGAEAGLANVLDALQCKSCHDLYRQEKK